MIPPSSSKFMQSQGIILPDDTPGQIDAILKGLGIIEASLSAFDAVYVVSALQLALSHPSMLSMESMGNVRAERFARQLSDGVSRHPQLKAIMDSGWAGVELVRKAQHYEPAPSTVEVKSECWYDNLVLPLPATARELRKVASMAKITGASRLRKTEARNKLKVLPQEELQLILREFYTPNVSTN